MTESEAIGRLSYMKNEVDVALMKSKYEKGHWLYDDVQGTADALQMAIKALEKQMPKKVKIEQWIYTKCDCGYEFSKHHGDGYYSIPYEKKTKYCPNCGQKLDWSSEE